MEAGRAAELGLRPLARVVSTAVAGVHPDVMGIGPVPAVRKALARAGIEAGDLDVVEINEAFASQSVACMDELGLDPARVNPNGGAIALGHPLGASGARLVTMLVHELAPDRRPLRPRDDVHRRGAGDRHGRGARRGVGVDAGCSARHRPRRRDPRFGGRPDRTLGGRRVRRRSARAAARDRDLSQPDRSWNAALIAASSPPSRIRAGREASDRANTPCNVRESAQDKSFAAGAGRNQLRCVGSVCSHREGATSDPKEIFAMLEVQPTVVSLSDAAAAKLAELTKEETSPDIGLRVYVYSGGCSGYRYGMMLEDQPTAEDSVLAANGVRVYIDQNSIPLIQGSEIDYVDTLMGAGFTVNNPNAVSGCGCGSSFRTEGDAGAARSCAH